MVHMAEWRDLASRRSKARGHLREALETDPKPWPLNSFAYPAEAKDLDSILWPTAASLNLTVIHRGNA